MAYDIGPKIGIEGEAEYKKAIKGINENLKTLGTEMKAVTSAYDRNDRSTEKLTAQNKVLTKQIDEQRNKVEMLRAKLEESAKEYGETDERTVEWQRSLNRATAALNKSELQLESNNKALASSADKWKAAAESAEAASKKWQDAGKAMSSAGDKIVTAATAAAAAIGALVIGTASYADEILTTSVQTGIATDELQKIRLCRRIS